MILHTWADLQAVPPARIWQLLRTTRHRPPGRARSGARRETFNAALEQAEQLLTAAGQVGPATRPILLFYGVSQLGRAVAASATNLDNNSYRLSGHGLNDRNLDGVTEHSLASIVVWGLERGAFPTVAAALRSATMTREFCLGELWSWIPDSGRIPVRGAATAYPLLQLLPEPASSVVLTTHDPLWVNAHVQGIPRQLVLAALESGDHKAVRDLMTELFSHYPGLSGWTALEFQTDRLFFEWGGQELLNLKVRLPKSTDQSAPDFVDAVTSAYHGAHYLYPTANGTGSAMHPFLIWWEVLFVLSKLARYQPREWAKLINVAAHPDAAGIEYLLSEALIALPEIAMHALERAADQKLT